MTMCRKRSTVVYRTVYTPRLALLVLSCRAPISPRSSLALDDMRLAATACASRSPTRLATASASGEKIAALTSPVTRCSALTATKAAARVRKAAPGRSPVRWMFSSSPASRTGTLALTAAASATAPTASHSRLRSAGFSRR